MKRDIGLSGQSRRDFIKGVITASAALGLGPLKALEQLERMGGSALAEEACTSACRVINIVAGNGGLSWFTLLWPVPQVAEQRGANYAYDDYSRIARVPGTAEGHPLYVRMLDGRPLWDKFGARKRVTAILTGVDETHRVAPERNNVLSNNVQLFAATAVLQNALQSLVPVISINQGGTAMRYGPAPGAPPRAAVSGAEEMVGLFSSAASRLQNRLGTPANRALYEQFHKAFLGLTRTANRPLYQRAYSDARVAAALLSQNLGEVLRPKPDQMARYVPNPNLPGGRGSRITDLAQRLIVTVNAFRLGLTAQVIIPAFNDDPHQAFDGGYAGPVADALARVMQALMEDLDQHNEPLCTAAGRRLSDNVVITVSGDTTKNPFDRTGWPDGAPGNSHWIYVMSNGFLKPGWFGRVSTSGRTNFNPQTGALQEGVSNSDATDASLAAVLYAVSRANERQVRTFFGGEYSGLIVPPSG
ncbi:MAG: hypothetical protein RMK29_06290 [Myxococcales bacterium]|nr:hypothetical protein [Myxococcota bacterium]MDW8281301.1 hypothetical protein [Myxococcales bacterium]